MQPTPPKPPQVVTDPVSTSAFADDPDTLDLDTQEAPVTTLDTSPKNYYQAIGWLRGKIIKDEERFCVQIRDVNFPLYLPRRVIAVATNLEGQMAWMKCYPQSKGEGLSFKVVWMGTEHNEESDPGIFVLRGVWQFIPQSRRPVFSIYRNELKNYENRPNNQHLPLIWSDQPPYRFRKDSEERPKFYQIMARLIPQRNCFGFVSQIADPLEQTPKRVKKTPTGSGNYAEKKFHKGDRQDDNQQPESKEQSPEPKDDQLDTAGVTLPETQSPIPAVPEDNAATVPDVDTSETPIAATEAGTVTPTEPIEPDVTQAAITPPSVEELAETSPAEADADAEKPAAKPKSTKKKTPAKSKSKKA